MKTNDEPKSNNTTRTRSRHGPAIRLLNGAGHGPFTIFRYLPSSGARSWSQRGASEHHFHPVGRSVGVDEPVLGRRSDVWGRKPVILLGLVGFGISTGGLALLLLIGQQGWLPLMTLYILMIIIRSIFGLFGSGSPSAAQAYIADRTTREERTGGVAAIGAAFGMGTIIGPGFAAVLAAVHLLAPFFAVAVFALCGAVAIALFLPERQNQLRAAQIYRH